MHALNNEQIDYTLIALCNALAIRHYLDVPICLVTTQGSVAWLRQKYATLVDRAFQQIIVYDDRLPVGTRRFQDTLSTQRMLRWSNFNRVDSYALTPFDETLLIDADYLVLDDNLKHVWGTAHEVMLNRDIIPLDHGSVPPSERWLEDTGIQLCWATVVYFRKSRLAEMLFDVARHVRKHYAYYALIYGYPAELYRNDYVFSIAVHMLSGFTRCDDIPTLPSPFLFTSFDRDELIDVPMRGDLTFFLNDRREAWRFTLTRTKDISVHVMNKFSIVRQADKLLSYYA